MAKPWDLYDLGEIVEITTPTSNMGLRKPLIVKLTASPRQDDGRWIVSGYRKILSRGKERWSKEAINYIASTITPRPFA